MKNSLKVDHAKCMIVMDRTFAKKSQDTRSEEYGHLQSVRRDYPSYVVVQRRIRKNANKKTYSGLTYEFMEDYIMTHGKPEVIKQNLSEFNEMRLISQCHGQSFRYPVIKSWFLENYPEIMEFGVETSAEVVEIGDHETENKPALLAAGF